MKYLFAFFVFYLQIKMNSVKITSVASLESVFGLILCTRRCFSWL